MDGTTTTPTGWPQHDLYDCALTTQFFEQDVGGERDPRKNPFLAPWPPGLHYRVGKMFGDVAVLVREGSPLPRSVYLKNARCTGVHRN